MLFSFYSIYSYIKLFFFLIKKSFISSTGDELQFFLLKRKGKFLPFINFQPLSELSRMWHIFRFLFLLGSSVLEKLIGGYILCPENSGLLSCVSFLNVDLHSVSIWVLLNILCFLIGGGFVMFFTWVCIGVLFWF